MPPWIIPELAPEAPEATSFFSNIKVLRPRIAASRAIPVPFTPPPITITSNSAGAVIFCCSLQQGVEKLLRSPPASLRSPWRAHVPPCTLRAPGPTPPRIWACSRRFSTPCRRWDSVQGRKKKPSASRSPHEPSASAYLPMAPPSHCFALDGASNRLQPGCQGQKMRTRRACALLKIESQTFLSEREDGSSSREDCRL